MTPARQLLCFGLLVGLVLALAPPTESLRSGWEAPDRFIVGCGDATSCHGGQTSGLEVALQGLPASYNPQQTYALNLSISGGPEPYNKSTQGLGGFDLFVSIGHFVKPANSTLRLSLSSREISHAANDTDQRYWQFDWVAPEAGSGNAAFRLAVLAGNGDNKAEGDQWTTLFLASEGSQVSTRDWARTGVVVFLFAGLLLYVRHKLRKADLAQREAEVEEEADAETEEEAGAEAGATAEDSSEGSPAPSEVPLAPTSLTEVGVPPVEPGAGLPDQPDDGPGQDP